MEREMKLKSKAIYSPKNNEQIHEH